jgi:hypothetical protein
LQGFAARVTSGVTAAIKGGPGVSLGGELGGIGNDFLM